jgi:hypothetical protein
VSGELRRALGEVAIPGAAEARQRSLDVAAAAYAEREPLPRRRRPVRPLALALAALLLAAAATSAVAPARDAVGDWVRSALRLDQGRPGARADLALPAPGWLLVSSARGPWVVPRHGARRLLGDYAGATWSPRGLFVAAWRGRTLAALEPGGRLRWALTAPARVTAAWWAPAPGFHIAYRAGGALWMVGGDGALPRRVSAMRGAAGAWRPGPDPVFAYALTSRLVELRSAVTGAPAGRFRASAPVRALAWTADGRRLVMAQSRELRVLDPTGRERARIALPAGARLHALALAPRGAEAALVRSRPGGRTDVALLDLARPGAPARTLLVAAGHLDRVTWSPDGRWLLVAWPRADQWLFVRTERVHRIMAASRVAARFAPGQRAGHGSAPVVEGWAR